MSSKIYKTFEIYLSYIDDKKDPVLIVKRSSDMIQIDQRRVQELVNKGSDREDVERSLKEEKEHTIARHLADKLGFTIVYKEDTICVQCLNNEDHDHDDPILLSSEYSVKPKI